MIIKVDSYKERPNKKFQKKYLLYRVKRNLDNNQMILNCDFWHYSLIINDVNGGNGIVLQSIRFIYLMLSIKRDMVKKLTIVVCLIYIVSSIGCQYYTQSSCTSVGCEWSNSTCIFGDGVCQGGSAYYEPIKQCVQCSTLGNSNCSSICSQYFYSSTASICQSCGSTFPNCLTCTVTGCSTCVSGYSINPQFTSECLINFCKIRFCQTCETNTTCFLCQTGYKPSLSGTVCSTSICNIPNCLFCTDATTCVSCRNEYQLNQTGTSCTPICRDPFCQSCSSPSVCTSCQSGYRFNSASGNCRLECKVPFCTNCDLSTTCIVCSSGYQLNNAYTLCNPICTDLNCATCTTQTNCIACNLGFSLTNGICTRDICLIQSCQVCQTSRTCSTCDSFSTISSDRTRCVQNCLSVVQNCRTCLTNTTCGACIAGYQLSSNKASCNVACIVSNCFTCLTNTLCSNCREGYITSNGGASCIFNCGILNCATCNSTTTCQTCQSPYTLSSAATSCSLACSPGFYLNVNSCQSCSTAQSNCLTCRLSTSNSSSVVCSVCQLLFYLTSAGDCVSCSSRISSCLLCNNPINCTVCRGGFNLVLVNGSLGCYSPSTCNVANCRICSTTNPLICTQCDTAYILTNSSNTSCSRITCLDTQYYDSATLTCVCPFGTFLSNRICAYCDVDNCVTCNSGGCLTCRSGYYVNEGSCKKCQNDCINCTSGTSCFECDYGYSLQDNGNCKKADYRYSSTEVAGTNSVAVCPAGCSQCTYNQGSIYCTVAKDGYAIDPSGNVLKCSDECQTCINTDYTICTSCYGASTLNNGACKGCADSPYALACPDNYRYSTACIIGYSPINGLCKKCAANCMTCGKAGEGLCDDNGCNPGYLKIVLTNNCTKCFSSCATCSTNNPSVCTSCGTSNFLSNTSSCTPCPSVCLSCSSSDVCTNCPPGYTFDSNWCYTTIGKPCATQSKDTCTSCFLGYNLVGGTCIFDDSCNGTSTCSTCDKGYYLSSRQCLPCGTDTTCDYCDPTSPSSCLFCAAGYFLRKNGATCISCSSEQTGCTLCLSAKQCVTAADGYYLEVDVFNEYTGTVRACKAGCAICNGLDSCSTCQSDYNKIGTTCLYNKNVQAKLTVASAQGSDTWFNDENPAQKNLANAYLQSNQIISSVASVSNITDLEQIILLSLSLGSLIIDIIVAASPTQDFSSFSSNIQNNINDLPDFKVIGSSIIVNGQSTSTTNLGLILGVTIPLVVLLAVIIIFVKIYLGDQADDKTTEETQKEIQDIEM